MTFNLIKLAKYLTINHLTTLQTNANSNSQSYMQFYTIILVFLTISKLEEWEQTTLWTLTFTLVNINQICTELSSVSLTHPNLAILLPILLLRVLQYCHLGDYFTSRFYAPTRMYLQPGCISNLDVLPTRMYAIPDVCPTRMYCHPGCILSRMYQNPDVPKPGCTKTRMYPVSHRAVVLTKLSTNKHANDS